MPTKRKIIVVGTNSLTEAQYPAYTNHCQMWFRFGRSPGYRNYDFIFSNPSRMSIDRMRNMTAKVALETEAEYVLFLDDDVVVPVGDGLAKLIAARADVAAGKIVIRGYPFDWMIFKYQTKKGHRGLFSQASLPDKGVIPVDAVGFSFCLIKTSVFKTIPPPWFITGVSNTEDIYFCIKAKQANPKLKIVCECSVNCGHILWPEIMDINTREAYKKYHEKLYPHVKVTESSSGDRSEDYLKQVKVVEQIAQEEKT
jgi:hypothetical protein